MNKNCSTGTDVPSTATIVGIEPISLDTAIFRLGQRQDFSPIEESSPIPGRFVQLSVPGGGEVPISVAGITPDGLLELCVRKAGHVTRMLHDLKPGDPVGVRGPFGQGFPVERWAGRDILLMAGGLGIAPLRSLILYLSAHREQYRAVTFMYGARDPSSLLFREELTRLACAYGIRLLLTVDFLSGELPAGLTCRSGLVTDLLSSSDFQGRGTVAAVCGPPALYRCVVPELEAVGVLSDDIYLSLERRMKCGTGICCHCAVGDLFCCTDGPVFRYPDIRDIGEAL